MANRTKRLESELALLEIEDQFKKSFKKEKVKRKRSLRPHLIFLADAETITNYRNCPHRKMSKRIFSLMKKLQAKDESKYFIFQKILRYPKQLFLSLIHI